MDDSPEWQIPASSGFFGLVLRSCAEEYSKLQEGIVSFGTNHGYSKAFLAELELTLKEAFVNALRHGNRENDALPVTVQFRTGPAGKTLDVTVRDCGRGFMPESIPDPTRNSFLHKRYGRGFHIIRSYAEIVGTQADDSGFSLTLRYVPR